MGCKRMSIADACRQAGGAALGMWLTLASAAVVVLTVEATVPLPSRPSLPMRRQQAHVVPRPGLLRLRGGERARTFDTNAARGAASGLRVLCGTWNVNGKPPLVPIEDWLFPCAGRDEVDVYVIALQEVQGLSGTAALLTDEEKGRPWSAILQQAVGAPTHFRCLAVRQMVGCYIAVLVRTPLCPHVTDVRVGELGTGFLNSGGNKGGVAVRFNFRGLSVCAISSHLAAQVSEVKRRNQDFHELLARLRFVDGSVLPRIKPGDLFDDGEDDDGVDDAHSLPPDVYDSPVKSPPAAQARTTSPLVLDSADAELGAGETHDLANPHAQTRAALMHDSVQDDGQVENGIGGELDADLPSYDDIAGCGGVDHGNEGSARQQVREPCVDDDATLPPTRQQQRQQPLSRNAAAATSVGRVASCPSLEGASPGSSCQAGVSPGRSSPAEGASGDGFLDLIPPAPTSPLKSAPLPCSPSLAQLPKSAVSARRSVGRSGSQIFGQLSSLRSSLFGSGAAQEPADVDTALEPGARLLDHDVVLWLGDLNYRLNLPEDAILGLLRERRMAVLQQFDQLTICKKAGEIFAGFVEPPITFVPTYKYDAWGTEFARKDTIDTGAGGGGLGDGEVEAVERGVQEEEGATMPDGDAKLPPDTGKHLKRPPAWCDRVLYRTTSAVNVEAIAYQRHEVLGSDHRPVSALLHLSWDVARDEAPAGASALNTAAQIAAASERQESESDPGAVEAEDGLVESGAEEAPANEARAATTTSADNAQAGQAHAVEMEMGWDAGGLEKEPGNGAVAAPAVMFELADEIIVAEKSVLVALGVCPAVWGTDGNCGSGGEQERLDQVLRVCKHSKAARWGPVDKALKSSMVAASTLSGGGGGRTEVGGGSVQEVYGVIGMAGMSFVSYLVVATNVSLAARLPQGRAFRITETQVVPVSRAPLPETMEDERAIDDKEFSHLKEISSGWGLFYSPDFDITQTQQRLAEDDSELARRNRDIARDKFVWNAYMLKALQPGAGVAKESGGEAGGGALPPRPPRYRYAESAAAGAGVAVEGGRQVAGGLASSGGIARQWSADAVDVAGLVVDDVASDAREVGGREGSESVEPLKDGMLEKGVLLSVVCGFVETVTVKVKQARLSLTLVSRRSRFRSGVRFFSRGVDAGGHVSNYVETEQLLAAPSRGIASYVSVRGSIPVYWQEGGALVTLKPKPHVQQGKPHLEAMTAHFSALAALYGPVVMLSLIDAAGNEANIYHVLMGLACRLLRTGGAGDLAAFEPFDFHAKCGKSASSGAAKRIAQMLNAQGSLLAPTNLFVAPEPAATRSVCPPAACPRWQVIDGRDATEQPLPDFVRDVPIGVGVCTEGEGRGREGVEGQGWDGDADGAAVSRTRSPGSELVDKARERFAAALRHVRSAGCSSHESVSCQASGDGGIGKQDGEQMDAEEVFARRQHGVARVNCIDCLDRTNVVQSAIGMRVFVEQLRLLGTLDDIEYEACRYATRNGYNVPLPAAESTFKHIWSDNGDALSMQYAGTGALKGDFTRKGKRTMGGILADLGSNVKRAVQNNFADVYRQRVIDMMHGQDTSGAKAAETVPDELVPPSFDSSEVGGIRRGGGLMQPEGDKEEEMRQVELDDLVSAEEGESIRQTPDVAEVEPSEWRDSGELEEEQEVLEVET